VLFCSWFFLDHNWYAAGKAVTKGYWSKTQRHHEAREVDQRTSWHVHGHGNACRKSGLFVHLYAETLWLHLLLNIIITPFNLFGNMVKPHEMPRPLSHTACITVHTRTLHELTKQKEKCYIALEIYISGQFNMLNKTLNFCIQAVFCRGWQSIQNIHNAVSNKLPSNICMTVTYKQFTNTSMCCFIWTDKEKLRVIQINQTENYFICVNKILVKSPNLETSKAQYC